MQPDAARPPRSETALAAWLFAWSALCLTILGAAVLGSGYTSLRGDWLSGDAVVGGTAYFAEVGLTEVHLQTLSTSPSSRTITLQAACRENGGVDSDTSKWCALDALGADIEALLTAAFMPALVVLALSAVTSLQICVSNGGTGADDGFRRLDALEQQQPSGDRSRGGGGGGGTCCGALYKVTMLLAWAAFWAMTAGGLCSYAFRAPSSLGIGPAVPSKAYGLMRACVLFTSLGAVALLAHAMSLWDTQTVQLLLRDVGEARLLKRLLYTLLFLQMLLYIPASLVRLDYAAVVCFLGLNYLATRAPQMLWGYVLLTLATLPQDAATLAAAERWRTMDYIDKVANGVSHTRHQPWRGLPRLLRRPVCERMALRSAHPLTPSCRRCHLPALVLSLTPQALLLIVIIKLLAIIGMAIMHTRVRFSLQFFEFDAESNEPAALEGSPAGFARSAAATPQRRGSPAVGAGSTTPNSATKALEP
jgi:hypothetical protein